MNAVPCLFAATLAFVLNASGQTPTSGLKPISGPVEIIYLKYANQANDLNEVLTTVRNMLPQNIRIYSVSTQNAIVLEAPEDQLPIAHQIVDALDRPRKSFHLTYTLTEVDGARRLPAQHASMNLIGGQPAVLKQGSRIPVITSNATPEPVNPTSQYSYVDVGLLIAATVTPVADGGVLKTKVEQSSIAPERTTPTIQNPNIHQTSLESLSILPIGKPTVIGSLDLPGVSHHLEIEALLEPTP